MNEIIYLESSEEITSVIDRLRENPASSISFVIPRGATLAQSIVNLKLLKKSATEMGKEISLVANDRISRNLASQIGLTVYSKVSEAEKAGPKITEPALKPIDDGHDEEMSGQFKVNNYYRNKKDDLGEDEEEIKKELKEHSEKQSEEESAPKMEMTSRPVGEHHSEENHRSQKETPEKKDRNNHVNYIDQKRENAHIKSEPNKPTNIKGSRKPIIILISIGVFAMLVLAYLFLPYTTIAIQVQTEDYLAEKEITIDRNAKASDASKLVLTGKLLEQEKEISKTFDATGKKDVGEKAAGTLSFFNDAGVDDQIPAGTVIKSSGGVEFVADQAISVPKASLNADGDKVSGKSTGKVTARQPGAAGNLPADTSYSVAGKSKISSSGATAGGVSREIKIVTEVDLQKAEEALKAEIIASGKTELLDLAKKDKLSIFDNSEKSEIISSSSTKNENEEADKFDYMVKIKLFAIGFVKGELDKLLADNLNSALGQDKMLINPDKAEIKYDLTDNDLDSGVLSLKAGFTGKSGARISEDSIKKTAKGKMVGSAKQVISDIEGVENVEVKNWPKVMPEIPWLVKRIKVTFDYAK